MAETLSIAGGFVYVEDVPIEEEQKRKLLIDDVLPLLYAFEGRQVTIKIEIAEPQSIQAE